MIQQLLPLMPKDLGTLAQALACIGMAIGVGLWLIGSRFSRALISLVLVSIGGWTGMFLPHCFGWSIDGWAPAVGMALALGVTGFLLHRMWVGVGFGLVLALWAGVITWMLYHGESPWVWPKVGLGTQAWPYLQAIWLGLPAAVQKVLPISGAGAFLVGLLAGMVWPRVGVVTLYSALGVSAIVGLGLCAMNFSKPSWVGALPAKTSSQAMAILGLVLFGALVQWKIGPKVKTAVAGAVKKSAAPSPH